LGNLCESGPAGVTVSSQRYWNGQAAVFASALVLCRELSLQTLTGCANPMAKHLSANKAAGKAGFCCPKFQNLHRASECVSTLGVEFC